MFNAKIVELNRLKKAFKELELHIIEKDLTPNNSIIYSVKIILGNKDVSQLGLGCNGNGLTYIDAVLSAYGELWERIMNDAFFRGDYLFAKISKKTEKLDSLFLQRIDDLDIDIEIFKKSKEYMAIKNLDPISQEVIGRLLNMNHLEDFELQYEQIMSSNHVAVKTFIQIGEEKKIKLPYLLLQNFSSVNGMCSGISFEHAISRGICEIIEKHCIWNVYNYKVSMVIIPRDFLKTISIFQEIEKLENNNFSVLFYNCLNEFDLPVIGTLIVNQSVNKYAFSISCHPNIETAISRGLVKIFKIDTTSKFNKILYNDEFNLQEEYFKTITDGTGKWPAYVFMNNKVSCQHYEYEKSYPIKRNYNLLIKAVSSRYKIYYCDNSFFDIPALYVFIPGLSEILYREADIDVFFDTQNMISSSIQYILKGLESIRIKPNNKSQSLYKDFRAFYLYIRNSHFLEEDYLLIMGLIHLHNKDYDSAEFYLISYVEITKTEPIFLEELPSTQLLIDFIRFRKEHKSPGVIIDLFNSYYPCDEIRKLKELVYSENKINEILRIPQCYNCSNCTKTKDCYLFTVMKIYSIILKVQISHSKNEINES